MSRSGILEDARTYFAAFFGVWHVAQEGLVETPGPEERRVYEVRSAV